MKSTITIIFPYQTAFCDARTTSTDDFQYYSNQPQTQNYLSTQTVLQTNQ
jgi:hypothetical protein